MPQLHVVAEVWGEFDVVPWPVSPPTESGILRLWASLSDEEVGRFIAGVARYCDIDLAGSPEQTFEKLAHHDYLVIAGGVQSRQGETVISPGCCVGTEEWRGWLHVFEDPFQSPLGGHDPYTWVEPTREGFEVKSGYSTLDHWAPATEVVIPFTNHEMEQSIASIAEDMIDFLARLSRWANAVAPSVADDLVRAIDYWFEISEARPLQS